MLAPGEASSLHAWQGAPDHSFDKGSQWKRSVFQQIIDYFLQDDNGKDSVGPPVLLQAIQPGIQK